MRWIDSKFQHLVKFWVTVYLLFELYNVEILININDLEKYSLHKKMTHSASFF